MMTAVSKTTRRTVLGAKLIRWVCCSMLILGASALTGCGGGDSGVAEIQRAQDECRDLEPSGSLITFYDEESGILTVRTTDTSEREEITVFDCLLKALDASDAVLEEFWAETRSYEGSHTVTLPNGIEAYWNLEETFIGYFAVAD